MCRPSCGPTSCNPHLIGSTSRRCSCSKVSTQVDSLRGARQHNPARGLPLAPHAFPCCPVEAGAGRGPHECAVLVHTGTPCPRPWCRRVAWASSRPENKLRSRPRAPWRRPARNVKVAGRVARVASSPCLELRPSSPTNCGPCSILTAPENRAAMFAASRQAGKNHVSSIGARDIKALLSRRSSNTASFRSRSSKGS